MKPPTTPTQPSTVAQRNLTTSERAAQTKARHEAKKAAKAATNVEALSKVINVVQALREISPAMTLNQALVFLEVARGCQGELGRIENLEVRRATGFVNKLLSTIVQSLSPYEYDRGNGKKLTGIDLLDLSESDTDGRAKSLYLTDKGHNLADKIVTIVTSQ